MDISGPLHIAFHMLQSIFIIYKDMMKWTQQVVNWKKFNVNKVSESFDTCRRLYMMMLDEIERLAVDLFMNENEELITTMVESNIQNIGLHIAQMYNQYINSMKSTDDRRLYLFGFITMASRFRNYWMATRRGDRVIMEDI